MEVGDLITLGVDVAARGAPEAEQAITRVGDASERTGTRAKAALGGLDPVFLRLAAEARRTSDLMDALAARESEVARAAQQAAQQARALAEANARMTAGMTAAGRAAYEASAGTRAWEAGLARLRQQQEAVTATAVGAAAGTGRLENAITGLGLGLAGLDGPVGNVLDKFGGFAIGGGVTAGVAAGIGLVVAAVEHFTKATREADKAWTDYLDTLRAPSQLAIAGAALDAAAERVRALQAAVARPAITEQQELAQRRNAQALTAAREELERLQAAYRGLTQTMGPDTPDARLGALARALEEIRRVGAGGFLPQGEVERLARLAGTMREFAGVGALSLGQRDQLQGLIDQADTLLRAQEKVAGLWTKLSDGPIQQTQTAVEAAAAAIPELLRGTARLDQQIYDWQSAAAAVAAAVARVADRRQTTLGAPEGYTGEAYNPAYTPTILLGAAQREALGPARAVADLAAETRDDWAATARAAVGFAQAIGGANDGMALLVNNAVTFGEQLQDAMKMLEAGKGLSAGGVFTLAGAGAGLLSSVTGLFGETAAARAQREATEQNTAAIRDLEASLGNFGLNISGTGFTAAQGGIAALFGGNVGRFLGLPNSLDTGGVDAFLRGQGTSLADLRDLAEQLGLTLNTGSFTGFVSSLQELDAAIKATELTRFADTFAGKLQALNAQWQIFDTQDPLQQLTEQLKVAAGYGITRQGGLVIPGLTGTGSPALAAAAAGLDLGTVAGRTELLGNLQDLFLQLKSGTLGAGDLGGLTGQEFLDQLTSLTGILRHIEQDAKARDDELRRTAESLRSAREALALNPALSVLSPIQQLAEARRQYARQLGLAEGGDQAAATGLASFAQQLLEASRAVNASGLGYVSDYTRVQDDLTRLEDSYRDRVSVDQKQLAQQQAIADNTAGMLARQDATITELRATVAVLQAGFDQAVDRLEAVATKLDENTYTTKRGLEALQ